jgi:glycogen debranching enzyme
MYAKDLKLDKDNDLDIVRGDFKLSESDQIHIEHILLSNKGFWFENPLLGVGIIDEINGATSKQQLKQHIRRQLVLDNYTVNKISISENYEIDVNAIRKI